MRLRSLLLTLAAWATPSMAAAADGELHTFHCLWGCPLGAPETNDTIVREIYTLSSNDLTKVADWVAYKVSPATIGKSEGRQWKTDPWLSADETLDPINYEGASAALHIDRGHQAPLASFSATPNADDTNLLSNITPQASALNQGPWVKLEDQERELAKRTEGDVYVYTGPLFERLMKPLPNGEPLHRVPSGYWKIIALADGRLSAFIFDQATPRRADMCDFRAPLIEVELRSRLDLFPTRQQADFKSLDPEVGCRTSMKPRPQPSEIPEG